ncbi:glutamate-rich protein 2 [Latimeria chalumnae]|uniref:glutamate-rich protein 2 n=1 Tax=Latimeria chalumnae TaxID=7897 RepID=UPI00313E1FEB
MSAVASYNLQRNNSNVKEMSDSSDGKDEEEEETSEEEEDRRAPIELLGEFLKAIMDQDYKLASKLCQMILIYEPENPEAKQFIPLIEEKLLLDETDEQTEDSEGTEDSTDDSEETEDSTEEDSDDSESDKDSDQECDDSSETEWSC